MPFGKSSTTLAALAAAAITSYTSLAVAGGHGSGLPGTHVAYGGDWNGGYVGVGLGGAWGDARFAFDGGIPVSPNPIDLDAGIAGGFHLGYQRQWGNVVVGLETSLLLADLEDSSTCPNPAFSCSVDVDWIWMVGPRFGFTARNLHFYGTGGYALGRLTSQTVTTATGATFDTGDSNHDGWYLGGGVAWNVSQALVFGVEYRRIELDEDRHASSTGLPGSGRNVDAEIDTIQARLTLKFGR